MGSGRPAKRYAKLADTIAGKSVTTPASQIGTILATEKASENLGRKNINLKPQLGTKQDDVKRTLRDRLTIVELKEELAG